MARGILARRGCVPARGRSAANPWGCILQIRWFGLSVRRTLPPSSLSRLCFSFPRSFCPFPFCSFSSPRAPAPAPSHPYTRDPRAWFNASRAALLIYAPNMYTRLALATGERRLRPWYLYPIPWPTSTGTRDLVSRIRTSHIMVSGARRRY